MQPISEKQRQKLHAQMAESVDALVSNTSGATRAGSTPALGTSSTKPPKASAAGYQICSTFFIVGSSLLHIEFHTDRETQDIFNLQRDALT